MTEPDDILARMATPDSGMPAWPGDLSDPDEHCFWYGHFEGCGHIGVRPPMRLSAPLDLDAHTTARKVYPPSDPEEIRRIMFPEPPPS